MKSKLSQEQIKKIISEAPDYCPITKMPKCESYCFDEGAVYLPTPAYDAFSIPEYNHEDRSFDRVRIDMDDDFKRYDEHLCDLYELLERPDLQEIIDFYKITDEELAIARQEASENDE